jgi:hypothetical protein
MRLSEWNWDAQNFEHVDYPDAPIVEFLNWLRTTKAWHADPEAVHRKLRKLNQLFADHRQALVEAAVATARNMTADVRAKRAAKNRENLAKARAVQAERRRLAKVAKAMAPEGELPRDF